jgi:salicylate biosynthesis isochorismate synthase
VSVRAQEHPFALPAAERETLARRAGEAIRRARRSGGTVVAALGWNAAGAVDPTAVVVASRRAGEPWFCLEQPDRGRVARAALGCIVALEASGADRFRNVASQWRALASAAVCEPDDGLAALGGFAFAPDGGQSPPWSGYAPASLQVPELLLVRRNGEVRLTAAALAAPDDTA